MTLLSGQAHSWARHSLGTARLTRGALTVLACSCAAGCTNPLLHQPLHLACPAGAPADPNAVLADYAALLKKCVRDSGQVDFAVLTQDVRTRGQLEAFLSWAAVGPPQPDRAFYLNVYNACALRAVLEFYPITRLRDARARLFDDVYFTVAQRQLNLADLARLAAPPQDWRVEFALGVPTLGGPALAAEPYAAARLDEQLNQAVQRYLGGCAGLRVDFERRRVLLGRLIWQRRRFFLHDYRRRYGTMSHSLLSALMPWAAPATRVQLADLAGFDPAELPWSDLLHDARLVKRQRTKIGSTEELLPCGAR